MFVSSVTGQTPSWPIGVYGSTKAALENMTIFLADELMADGIRVNGVAPGLIKTDFSQPIWTNKELDPKSIGQPEDIGAAMAFICSEEGKFVNRTTVTVHGGFPKL